MAIWNVAYYWTCILDTEQAISWKQTEEVSWISWLLTPPLTTLPVPTPSLLCGTNNLITWHWQVSFRNLFIFALPFCRIPFYCFYILLNCQWPASSFCPTDWLCGFRFVGSCRVHLHDRVCAALWRNPCLHMGPSDNVAHATAGAAHVSRHHMLCN